MNNAQLNGLRNLHNSTIAIAKTEQGWEVRKGGKLQGVATTLEGAKEIASIIG